MARNIRQNKILEIIINSDIETQDELVKALRSEQFDVTQATVSRDIKELGLIKRLNPETKRYKYVYIDKTVDEISTKIKVVLSELIVGVKCLSGNVVIKTLNGVGTAVMNLVSKLSLDSVYGTVAGDDTVLLITNNNNDAEEVSSKIKDFL